MPKATVASGDALLEPTATPALPLTLLATAQLAFIPSAGLVMLLFAAAVAPGYALAHGALAQVPASAPALVHGLVLGLALAGAYAVFVATFPLLVALSRLALGVRGQEGRIRITSPRMFAWYHGLLSTYAVNVLAGAPLRALGLYKWFARAMGMKIGRGSVLNTTSVYDHDLLEVGDYAVVGGDAFLTGHVVEDGWLIRRKVRIGHGATLGLRCVVLPGATIGDGAQVGAMALVPKDAVLAPHTVYAGVPARPVRSRRR